MMFAERLQFQKFIMISLLAHLIFAGLLSAVRISMPFPPERPLRVRIVDQPRRTAVRPPLQPKNLGEFSARAQRPAEKEGPARAPDSSLLPGAERVIPRMAITPPPASLAATPGVPAPRPVPSPSIPSAASPPSALADLSPPPSTAGAPRVIPSPSIPPPPRVPPASAASVAKAVPAPPSATAAPRASSPPAPSPPAMSSEGAVQGAPSGRAGTSDPKGRQGPRRSGVEADERTGGQYDLRGQVAMLWKSLDPRQYPYHDIDTDEDGDTGSTTERTVSLDTQDSRFASYLLGVKRRIEALWAYPPGARGLSGNLVITFGITRDGRLADLHLTETSGLAPLDNEAVRAIREAAPFAPFPGRMQYERLNIRAAFYYYASRAGVRGR